MELAHSTHHSADETFRTEALPWLPNVARYARLLTRNAADADDLAQETFLRAYLNWGTFRPGTDCRKWLFTICRHLFLRSSQRAKRMVGVDDPDVDIQRTAELYWEAAQSGLENLFDRIDVGPALARGIEAMAPEYRAVVILVDVEDASYADTATALGIPIGTVRSRLFRARRLLQQTLIEHARDLGLAAETAIPRGDGRVLV